MSHLVTDRAAADDGAVLHQLSVLDRLLPVWIVLAMVVGLLLGRTVEGLDEALDEVLDEVQVGSVSLPIAVGLLVMMYPVLAEVRYGRAGEPVQNHHRVGPVHRDGSHLERLSCGDRKAAAVLVAVIPVFQIVAFATLGWFHLEVLPGGSVSVTGRRMPSRPGRSPSRCWSSSGYRCSPATSPARWRKGPAGGSGASGPAAPARAVGAVRLALHGRGAVRPAGRTGAVRSGQPTHRSARARRFFPPSDLDARRT